MKGEREPTVYADPSTVRCPRCDAPPESPCLRNDGSPLQHWHVARERCPILYECRVCHEPFSVSLATGAWVHVGKIDETHSAAPYDDLRRWRLDDPEFDYVPENDDDG